MTLAFRHKDQEFFNEMCKLLPSFAKRFQAACEAQWNDSTNFIVVARDCYDTGFHWSFDIPKRDIEYAEVLKPFKWYPASKWNGNPQDHALIERAVHGKVYLYKGITNMLTVGTEFFMLVPRDKDIKPKC